VFLTEPQYPFPNYPTPVLGDLDAAIVKVPNKQNWHAIVQTTGFAAPVMFSEVLCEFGITFLLTSCLCLGVTWQKGVR
jgi:hypothetical protein